MAHTGPASPLTVRDYWRRWRFPVWVVVGVLATALLVTVFNSQQGRGYLDPNGVDRSGSRAVAQLLSAQGVELTEARTSAVATAAAGPETTVLITDPWLLAPEQLEQLIDTGADLVLINPGESLTAVDIDIDIASDDLGWPTIRAPGCELREAVRAGTVRIGGDYEAAVPATICYDGALVVAALDDGSRIAVLGSPDVLTNRRLDEDGNAALALNLLGHHPTLVWYRPTLGDYPEAGAQPLTQLLPGWVVPAVFQLGIAALIAAWWRARRLGPVVAEPLPVVVRAAETTEGRARLYRRGRARGHAADTLREAAADRLRRRLGQPTVADVVALAESIAVRTNRRADEVAELLAGPEPPDDAALVRLANDLDALEQEVRNL